MTEKINNQTDFLSCVLVTAVEGGIGYWAEVRNYHWTEDTNHNLLSASAEIKIEDTNESEWQTLNLDVIRNGIEKIQNNEVNINRDMLKSIVAGNITNDAGEIDSDGADCIVQAALFGEIIYG